MSWLLPVGNAVAIVICILTLIYWSFCIYIMKRSRRLMPELAYPEDYLPLIGHLYKFIDAARSSTDMWQKMSEYCDYYKAGFQGFIGHQIWIFMPDQEVIQELLGSHEAIEKSYVYRTLEPITDGVFIAPGMRWRKLRKRLNLTFSAKQIESYMEAVNHHTEVFCNVVIRKLSQSNEFIDIQPYVARCFFDIMTKTHFAADTDEQVKDEYKVSEKTSIVIEKIIDQRLLKPYFHPDFIFRFTELCKFIEKIRVKPYEFISKLVQDRMDHIDSGKYPTKESSDTVIYVDLVREAMREMNMPINLYDLQRSCNDLLIAGSDTTSITAATLLYKLALFKDMQEKVYEEVSRVYGQDSYRPLTRQELASMPYLEMAMNEALRWSAPPGIVRELHKDLDVGKYTIPKGANIYVMMSAQHLNPLYYEKVDKFYPEHFTSEQVKARPKMAFLPFSFGPRNCPGKSFAYILIKAAVALVINNYTLDTDLPMEVITRRLVLMTQHNQGYPIKFTPRHHNTPRG